MNDPNALGAAARHHLESPPTGPALHVDGGIADIVDLAGTRGL